MDFDEKQGVVCTCKSMLAWADDTGRCVMCGLMQEVPVAPPTFDAPVVDTEVTTEPETPAE